eukprot:2308380-Rhodomonas_salina.1
MAAPAPIITARAQEALESGRDVDWNAGGDRPAAVMEGQWSPPPTGWRWRPDIYVGDAAAAGANASRFDFRLRPRGTMMNGRVFQVQDGSILRYAGQFWRRPYRSFRTSALHYGYERGNTNWAHFLGKRPIQSYEKDL